MVAGATATAGREAIFTCSPLLDGALEQLRDGGDAQGKLIVAASWDVAALTTATVLAVYKPGRRRRRVLTREDR